MANPTDANDAAPADTTSNADSAAPPSPPPQPSPLATAEAWDLVAAAYAVDSLPYFEVFSRAALAHAALPPGARVADIAAGPGTISLLAAAAGARVDALDFSEPMLAELRARVAAAGLGARIEARFGDGQRLPYAADTYDAAFSMFGLMFFPDRAAGLREMLRVLRPGGVAIISSWVPFAGPFGTLLQAARELLPGLPLGGGRPPLADPADIVAEMTAAGFADVRVETIAQEIHEPSFDSFWALMQRTNAPVVLIRHRVGPERWREVEPQLRERVRATIGDGPVAVGRGAYLGIARKR